MCQIFCNYNKNLSKQNFVGLTFALGIDRCSVFIYRLNLQRFHELGLYLKCVLYKILVNLRFGLDRFDCTQKKHDVLLHFICSVTSVIVLNKLIQV